MKLISWNVNGLRAAMGKGFLDFAKEQVVILKTSLTIFNSAIIS